MTQVVIVPTGTANLASVMAGFRRLGAEPVLADGARMIREASHVMLPGVGAFGASMKRLRAQGFDSAMRARIESGLATICICVGYQLLFETSDESPGERGLGLIPGHVGRFTGGVRTPQFGWNKVEAGPDCRLLEDGYAYFANSYRAVEAPGWTVALAEHGGPFVAGIERGKVLGCQFHPELSGPYGEALLSRFLELS